MRLLVASLSAFEREQMRHAALSLGHDCDVADCVAPAELVARLRRPTARLALMTARLDVATDLSVLHAVATSSSTPVFVVTDAQTESSVPALLRAGARGYLRAQHLRDDLRTVVQDLQASSELRLSWGRVIGVTGGLPGIGVTTVATHLAFAFGDKQPGRVALAQLSDAMPDLALNLDLKPSYPLAELAKAWYRLDAGLLGRCMANHPAGVAILADQADAVSVTQWQPEAMRQVLMMLRSRFESVVVDLGHSLDAARQEAIRLCDTVAVVTRLDMPALRATRDWLTRICNLGVLDDRLIGVVNRVGQKEQLSWKTARETLGVTLAEAIEDDAARINYALNSAQPLVTTARHATITAGFGKLAARTAASPRTGATDCRLLAGVG